MIKPEPSQPNLFSKCFLLFKGLKKGKMEFLAVHYYGRFLSISTITIEAMAIATIIAIAAAAMYIPVGGCAAACCGDAVGAGALA
jgi:hypothetical protein